MLSAQVGTKFTATGLPTPTAPRATMELFVEGKVERITMDEVRVILHTSPAELFDVFILGSATHGILDTDRLAY